MNIVVSECTPPFFVATLNGEPLCRSKTPLLTSARILIKAGVNPAEELVMVREDGIASMRTTVGDAAKLRVTTNSMGTPIFKSWEGPDSD